MLRSIAFITSISMLAFASCANKESVEAPKPSEQTPVAAQPASGPHAFVHLQDGSKISGAIVASSQTHMVVAGDDGIERRIPLAQIKSVEYGEAPPARQARQSAPPKRPAKQEPAPLPQQTLQQTQPSAATTAPQVPITAKTYELPLGSEVSVRTNEPIDSGTAAEAQTFDAQVTRDVRDANGDVVIPRGSSASIVIKSASKGGRFRGASDLVLDLQSVTINGKPYTIDTADITEKGKSGVGANKRTAEYTGGGAALGAIIGAIAGGGKGAAIGAGAGAGAGALTQVLTKGGAIKVPAESVLTFNLDKPLRVTAAE
jgi:hypothetical protein